MKIFLKKFNWNYGLAIVFCLVTWLVMSNEFMLICFENNRILFSVTTLLIYIGGIVIQYEMTGKIHDRMLLLGGFVLQFIYVIMTEYNVSPHDLGYFPGFGSAVTERGHLGFIAYIFNFEQIPQVNPMKVWGYYNPPFHYILEAVWLKINCFLGFEEAVCLENMQYLTMLYTTMSMSVLYTLMEELELSEKARKIWTLIIAFHPFFIFTAGSLSNDGLSMLLLFVAILYTIRWYRDNSLKNIMILAFAIGFGMMTKLNVGLVAPATAFVFLVVLIRKRREWKKLFVQFGLFGIVCVPLGLWWSIRNLVRYNMPIGYVQSFGDFTGQEIMGYSFLGRLRPEMKLWLYPFMSFNDLAYRLDYGIPSTLIKTSLFCDERLFLDNYFGFYVCRVLVFVTLALFVLAGVMVLWKIFEHIRYRKWDDIVFWFAIIALAVQVVSYVSFCFAYPNVCSADFRYVVGCMAYLMILMRKTEQKRKHRFFTKLETVSIHIGHGLTVVFAGISVFIYLIHLLTL